MSDKHCKCRRHRKHRRHNRHVNTIVLRPGQKILVEAKKRRRHHRHC